MSSLQVASDSLGAGLASSPASENWAIPVDSNGAIPQRCYIACTADIHFLLAKGAGPESASGETAVTIIIGQLLKAEQPLVIKTRGFTHFMTIGIAGTETFVITPLEN